MPETIKVTTLGELKKGDLVNIESPLRWGEELGGHFVLGHVDGVGKITKIQKHGNATVMTISNSRELEPYIVHKGSITVDGVSLTVIKPRVMNHKSCVIRRGSKFKVSLAPFTLQHTNLGNKKIGQLVNLEVDVLARYSTNRTRH